jgi:hypothetical protein
VEIGIALVTLAMGLVTLALAETAAAEVLLAVFVAAIAVAWVVEMLHHAGVLPVRSTPTALPRR